MKKQYQRQYSPKQGRLPVYIADILDICDSVLTFDQIMEEIGIEQYLKPDTNPWHLGRPRFNQVNMLNGLVQLHGHGICILEGYSKAMQG